MKTFIILGLVFTIVYLLGLALVIHRRKSPFILRRSPIMLALSLLGNMLQSILLLTQLDHLEDYFVTDAGPKCNMFLRFRQSGNLIFHYIMFFPYVLRAYRIYLIFKLDKHWDDQDFSFNKYSHRTRQRWMLGVFMSGLIPFVVMVIIVLTDCTAAEYMPASEYKGHEYFSQSFYIWISCLEQVFFVYSIYLLREISDGFNMIQELFVAMLFWFISPIFSVFPAADLKTYEPVPGILRNCCLFIVSIMYPLIWSYRDNRSEEVVTLEMLESLELILQNKTTLEYFETFMRNLEHKTNETNIDHSGCDILEVYMKCETFLIYPEMQDKSDLIESLLRTDIISFNYIADMKESFNDQVFAAKNKFFYYLSINYFTKFQKSKQYALLRRIVHRQEIYTGRLLQIGFSVLNYVDMESISFNYEERRY